MEEGPTTEQLDGFLEIRKPGAHLEEGVIADDFVLMLGVDLVNYPKFPKVDDTITYPKKNLDVRYQLDLDSGAELDDYSGPWRPDLRYTDFSTRRKPSRPGSFPGARRISSSASTVGRTKSPSATEPRRWPTSNGPDGTTRLSPSSSA